MKLVRCYIENFGGLQQYTVDFSDGLTVIHQPNGFGKTTLAEFIRAMFYGFPRGNKDVSKNLRQKYAPWQGGRYGGFLIFEHGDKRYRIDRTFGDTPKNDKFKLFNEDTHKEVKDFGADIGLALFGLDADSFIRSTYMPQSYDNSSLTTDNIRAKLGNLLEDTGDLGSYEKALQRLKDKRNTYEQVRGAKGSVNEARRKISELQQEMTLCEAKVPQLEALTAELETEKREQSLDEDALLRIRRELSEATTAQAEAALSREYEGLVRDVAETEAALTPLLERFPKGIPAPEDLEAAAERMEQAARLDSRLPETDADRKAADTLARMAERFAEGVPTAEDFTLRGADLDRLMTADNELRGTALTHEEETLLAQLNTQLAHGIPEEAALNQWREQIAELTALQHTRPTLEPTAEDKAALDTLDAYFAEGVPDREDLDRAEQKLNRSEALRRENLQLSAAVPAAVPVEPAPQKKFHSLFLPLLILGILAAGAGIYLLTTPLFDTHTLVGGICAALGAMALVAAAILQNNHSLMSKLQGQLPAGGMTAAQRSIIEENEGCAAALDAEVEAFLAAYPAQAEGSLRSRLAELSTNRSLYLPLCDRRAALTRLAAENDARTAALTEALHKALSPYFDTILSFDTALRTLERRIQQYDELSHKQEEIALRRAQLTAEIVALKEQLSTFLLQYGGKPNGEGFRQAMDTLRRDADAFTDAQAHLRKREEALAALHRELNELTAAHEDFAAQYGLSLAIDDRQALRTAERDAEAVTRLQGELTDARTALEDFVSRHGHKPMGDAAAVQYDLEGLKLAEQELLHKQKLRSQRILQLEQSCRLLRADIDRLPELADELNRQMQRKEEDSDRVRLLDCTTEFLQQARESLSGSYMRGVQKHFAEYLNRLTGEQTDRIAVNSDLEVQLERLGSARPLTYFSAGQNDAVHLCMRLALSDALFEGEHCFMILDDPFVNLDDHHTAQALALLEDLSKDRQIVYLVCNSSRV